MPYLEIFGLLLVALWLGEVAVFVLTYRRLAMDRAPRDGDAEVKASAIRSRVAA